MCLTSGTVWVVWAQQQIGREDSEKCFHSNRYCRVKVFIVNVSKSQNISCEYVRLISLGSLSGCSKCHHPPYECKNGVTSSASTMIRNAKILCHHPISLLTLEGQANACTKLFINVFLRGCLSQNPIESNRHLLSNLSLTALMQLFL